MNMNIRKYIQLTIATFCIITALHNCADYVYGDPEPPIPPDPVVVEVKNTTDSSVTLSWTKCENDSFKSYVVIFNAGEYSNSKAKVFDTLLFSIDTTIVIKPLEQLTPYSFRVTVVTINGVSSPSLSVTATTLKRMKGTLNLSQQTIGTDVHLTWTKSVTPCYLYKIFTDSLSAVDSTKALITIITKDTDTTYTYRDQPAGSTMYYRVYAINDTGSYVAKSSPVMVVIE